METAEAMDIIERIAAAYTQFDLKGREGQRRIDLWIRQLKDMPYDRVSHNVQRHIKAHRFPPTIAEIAASYPAENTFLEEKRTWREETVSSEVKAKFKQDMQEFLRGLRDESN